MRYAMTRDQAAGVVVAGDTVTVAALFDTQRGCDQLTQRLLSFAAGRCAPRGEPSDDEVLYVLEGAGSVEVGDARGLLAPGVGFSVPRATPWSVECAAPLELLSVAVRAPQIPGEPHVIVDLVQRGRASATAARQFTLGVGPGGGCASATQFIGFVPPGRAPDHYHRYDEVIYILEGDGMLHVGSESTPLRPGDCVHLPAGRVHCLENRGASELRLLGVFTPGGSPAEAYYPDGTPAVYPQES
jgi:mannose-6-phosphate isomerase-like protein (cupin superfamily)